MEPTRPHTSQDGAPPPAWPRWQPPGTFLPPTRRWSCLPRRRGVEISPHIYGHFIEHLGGRYLRRHLGGGRFEDFEYQWYPPGVCR